MTSRKAFAAVLITICFARPGFAQQMEDFVVPNASDPSWCNSTYAENNADLSDDPAAPTNLALCAGVNTVSGSVENSSDVRDFFSINTVLSPTHRLDAVFLTEYVDGNSGASGNTGFIHLELEDGSGTEIPSGATVGGFLGAAHLDRATFPAGENILDILGQAPLGGTGFSDLPDINENIIIFNVQQTGPELTNYTLEFHVSAVPEPATGSSWLAVLVAAGLLRRRRPRWS